MLVIGPEGIPWLGKEASVRYHFTRYGAERRALRLEFYNWKLGHSDWFESVVRRRRDNDY
jgi:hypothetical protein